MGVEYMTNAYNSMNEFALPSLLGNGIKGLVILGLTIQVIKKYLKGTVNERTGHFGLQISDLVYFVFTISFIIMAPYILKMFDAGLVSIVKSFQETSNPTSNLPMIDTPIESIPDSTEGWLEAIAFSLSINSIMIAVHKVSAAVLWLLDIIIFPLFLGQRFFILGLMRIFFPLMIGLSALGDKWDDLVVRFFKLYIAVYLMLPAYMLVNVFVNGIYKGMHHELTSNLFSGAGAFLKTSDTANTLVGLAVLAFIVMLKFKLYKKAGTFMFRLFGV